MASPSGSLKGVNSFATSEASSSLLNSVESERQDQSTLVSNRLVHVEFSPGPDIELRPLKKPDSIRESISEPKAMTSRYAENFGQWRRYLDDWGWEIAACLRSLMAFLGIIGLMKAFDGKAQPSWPYGITLNSAVAVFSTVTKGLLLVPAAACISQSIWITYAEKSHPLRTLTTYDAASRGPLGAVSLIWNLKARRLACLGAGLVILAAGIGPTVQQTIVVDTRQVPTAINASLPRARSFIDEIHEETNSVWSWFESDIVPTGMIGLLYSGLYRGSTESSQAQLDVVPNCPTNDCLFPRFDSLAVCSSCIDVAPKMNRSCFTERTTKSLARQYNVTQCTFSLPNGLEINQTTLTPDTLAVSAVLKPIEGDDNNDRIGNNLTADSIGTILQTTILNASTSNGIVSADAHQCSLSWCVKTYEAKVVNGDFEEREIESRTRWDWFDDKFVNTRQFSMNVSSSNRSHGPDYLVYEPASIKITNWLLYKFTFSNSKYLKVQREEDDDWFRFWEDKTSNFTGDARSVSHLRDTIKTMLLVGYEEVFANVAKALTTYIRTDAATDHLGNVSSSERAAFDYLGPVTPLSGTSYKSEVYIRIVWPWLLFLGFILVCTILFLVLTIHKSSKYKLAAWKSEPLALMYHGLEANKEEYQRLDRVEDMHYQGKRTRVQLQETESGLRLGYADK